MEKTVVFVKPDAFYDFRRIRLSLMNLLPNGFRIIHEEEMIMTVEKAMIHYQNILDKDFWPEVEEFITSGPIWIMIIEGNDAVNVVRDAIGRETDPLKNKPNTIRFNFGGKTIMKNGAHASCTIEDAKREMKNLFPELELGKVA